MKTLRKKTAANKVIIIHVFGFKDNEFEIIGRFLICVIEVIELAIYRLYNIANI